MLALVRHARAVKDPARSPETWELDPEGEEDVAALRAAWDWGSVSQWFSSDEPKAVQTAGLLTDRQIEQRVDLREVQRGGWTEDYEATVTRLITRPDVPPDTGWETADSALDRFHRTVWPLLKVGENVAVVSHGLVITLWCAAVRNRPVDMAEWRSLRFPDALLLSDQDINSLLSGTTHSVRFRRAWQTAKDSSAMKGISTHD